MRAHVSRRNGLEVMYPINPRHIVPTSATTLSLEPLQPTISLPEQSPIRKKTIPLDETQTALKVEEDFLDGSRKDAYGRFDLKDKLISVSSHSVSCHPQYEIDDEDLTFLAGQCAKPRSSLNIRSHEFRDKAQRFRRAFDALERAQAERDAQQRRRQIQFLQSKTDELIEEVLQADTNKKFSASDFGKPAISSLKELPAIIAKLVPVEDVPQRCFGGFTEAEKRDVYGFWVRKRKALCENYSVALQPLAYGSRAEDQLYWCAFRKRWPENLVCPRTDTTEGNGTQHTIERDRQQMILNDRLQFLDNVEKLAALVVKRCAIQHQILCRTVRLHRDQRKRLADPHSFLHKAAKCCELTADPEDRRMMHAVVANTTDTEIENIVHNLSTRHPAMKRPHVKNLPRYESTSPKARPIKKQRVG